MRWYWNRTKEFMALPDGHYRVIHRCGMDMPNEKWIIRVHLRDWCPLRGQGELPQELAWTVEQLGREKSNALGIEGERTE